MHPNVIYVENLLDRSGLKTLLQLGDAWIYDDTEPITGAGLRGNTEPISIAGTGTDANGNDYIYLDSALVGAGLTPPRGYTAQFSGNLYQLDLEISDRIEFDIPIKTKWCKIAQIKIVQQTAGDMLISFEIWEEHPVYEGNRLEMHKNVIRRNIELSGAQGGWYGESLVNNLILFRDGEVPGEEGRYNLHCALVNEDGGTVSDFHVLIKIAEIEELV